MLVEDNAVKTMFKSSCLWKEDEVEVDVVLRVDVELVLVDDESMRLRRKMRTTSSCLR